MDIQQHMAGVHQAMREYVRAGFAIIPLRFGDKRPIESWGGAGARVPSMAELEDWIANGYRMASGKRVGIYNIGIACIDRLVVVDCDSAEAEEAAEGVGLVTHGKVTTRRGCHLYFKTPAGVNLINGVNVGGVKGLDLRANGGYVVAPPSVLTDSNGAINWTYRWDDIEAIHDLEEFPVDEFKDLIQQEFIPGANVTNLNQLDLRMVNAKVSAEHDARLAIDRLGRKLRDGDGRNQLLTKYVGEVAREELEFNRLVMLAVGFQAAYFEEPLPEEEMLTIIRSIISREVAKGHQLKVAPQYNPNQPQQASQPAQALAPQAPSFDPIGNLLTASKIDDQLSALSEEKSLLEPLIQPGTITQLVGFNGHGKSIIGLNVGFALASGTDFGPFRVERESKVLYLDFETPKRTLLERMAAFRLIYGDPSEKLGIWSSSFTREDMSLNTEAGLNLLNCYAEAFKPDVVVIDTVRSAWPGLEEQSANAWSGVNRILKSIRDAGVAVVIVHHRNKPSSEGALGREAGSTAQLTDIDTQVIVTAVFKDAVEAKRMAGLSAEQTCVVDASGREWTAWDYLEQRMPPDSRIISMTEVSYGKLRNRTELHETHYIAWTENILTGERAIISTLSLRQKARVLANTGMTDSEIAQALRIGIGTIKQWVNRPKPVSWE